MPSGTDCGGAFPAWRGGLWRRPLRSRGRCCWRRNGGRRARARASRRRCCLDPVPAVSATPSGGGSNLRHSKLSTWLPGESRGQPLVMREISELTSEARSPGCRATAVGVVVAGVQNVAGDRPCHSWHPAVVHGRGAENLVAVRNRLAVFSDRGNIPKISNISNRFPFNGENWQKDVRITY